MSKQQNKIMSILRKHRFTIAGVILGAIAGFAYWKFIGCSSGTCPITSKPFNSTLYGSIMGGLFFNIINDLKTSKS
jgi:hypothetical protein